MNRTVAKDAKRWVVKIGSALLTGDGATRVALSDSHELPHRSCLTTTI